MHCSSSSCSGGLQYLPPQAAGFIPTIWPPPPRGHTPCLFTRARAAHECPQTCIHDLPPHVHPQRIQCEDMYTLHLATRDGTPVVRVAPTCTIYSTNVHKHCTKLCNRMGGGLGGGKCTRHRRLQSWPQLLVLSIRPKYFTSTTSCIAVIYMYIYIQLYMLFCYALECKRVNIDPSFFVHPFVT